MKQVWILLLSICLCLLAAGCNHENSGGENSISPPSGSSQQISEGKPDTGGVAPDFSVDERYKSISSSLIGYVGQEAFEEWIGQEENINIFTFIQYFKIPKDIFTQLVRYDLTPEFCESFAPELTLSEIQDILGYSFSEIDALYSGDQEQINRAFCGPLAFVNDADGEIYSIDWLVEHTPQEYIDAQLPLDQVQAVIDKTASDEFRFYDLAETAQQKLDIARTLSSDPGSSDEQTAPSDTSASFTE